MREENRCTPGLPDRWVSSGQTTPDKVSCGRWRSVRVPNEMPYFDAEHKRLDELETRIRSRDDKPDKLAGRLVALERLRQELPEQ